MLLILAICAIALVALPIGDGTLSALSLLILCTIPPGAVHLPQNTHPSLVGLIVAALCAHWRTRGKTLIMDRQVLLLILATAGVLVATFVVTITSASTPYAKPQLQIVLCALAASALLMQADRGMARAYGKAWVLFGVVLAVLALYERSLGVYLFDGPSIFHVSTRGGIRSQLWLQQTLILSLFLCVAICLTASVVRQRAGQILVIAVLASGLTATASRTAIVSGCAVVLVLMLRRLSTPALMFLVAYVVVLVGAFAPQLYARFFNLDNASSLSDLSTSYRLSLYPVLGRDLLHHPFGFGLGGVPRNHYLVATAFGTKDLGASVDNSFLVVAALFGWAGFGLIFLLVLRILRNWRVMSTEALAVRLVLLVNALSFSLISFVATVAFVGLAQLASPSIRGSLTEGGMSRRQPSDAARSGT